MGVREIIFRGKRVDNGVWFEGSLLQYKVEKPSRTEKHYKIQEFNYGYSDDELINQEYMSGFDEEVTPETIGQYTGLTDKNGKKIFEGDIVKVSYTEKREYMGIKYDDEFELIEQVFYAEENACFMLKFDNDGIPMYRPLHDFDTPIKIKELEVIGNIYDNPELLGE